MAIGSRRKKRLKSWKLEERIQRPELEVGPPVDVCTMDCLFPNCPALSIDSKPYVFRSMRAVIIPTYQSTSPIGSVDPVSGGHVVSLLP